MKPKRLLDLYCGAGGAAMGYYRAGFTEIVGIDIKPQPRYPFTFIQADALDYLAEWGFVYDAIHASPPCQRYTHMLNHGLTSREVHPDLVRPTRLALEATGKPFVIENVPGAPLLNPIVLCGEMFGLRVTRHRLFESNWMLLGPSHPRHQGSHIRKQNDGGYYFRVYGHETGKAEWGAAMGIDWMRSPELAQAVPPAYTEWIGKRILEATN